jgi:hypothetical protein
MTADHGGFMNLAFRRIAIFVSVIVAFQASVTSAEAGFLRSIVAGSALEIGGAIALSLAAKRAIECYHDLDHCPRERELAGRLANAIEAKLSDDPDLDGTAGSGVGGHRLRCRAFCRHGSLRIGSAAQLRFRLVTYDGNPISWASNSTIISPEAMRVMKS